MRKIHVLSCLGLFAAAIVTGCATEEADGTPPVGPDVVGPEVEDGNDAVACDSTAVWEGDFEIRNNTDLDALAGYDRVTGDIMIANANVAAVDELECLTSARFLYVQGNSELVSLAGLRKLASVSEGVYIVGNPALRELGLSSLTTVGGDLTVTDNAALATCRAVLLRDRLREAGWQGDATIEGNNDGAMCVTAPNTPHPYFE